MTDRIRQSIELSEILDATVNEMRMFLRTDRVKVYQFCEDDSGEVVAEAIKGQRLPSLLGHRFPAEDIPEYAREMFLTARQRTIINVAKGEIGISPLLCHTTRQPLPTNLWFRPVDPCHVEYLKAMGVQSSLVAPILHRHHLWGLLVAHHSLPRRFSHKELEVVQLIADQVAVAITHASLLRLTRLQGRHEAIINQVVSLLHSTSNEPLQTALDQTVAALDCAGGRLYVPPGSSESVCQLALSGIQPELPEKLTPIFLQKSAPPVLEELPEWQLWLESEAAKQSVAQLWAIEDVGLTPISELIAYALIVNDIRGVLVAKLTHRNRFLGYLSLFRQSIDVEVVWAGRLDASDLRQRRPRQSFETWRELKRGQAHPWKAREIGLVQELADRFASVIYQTQLYREVQALNTDLEQRVMQRTADLQTLNEALRQEILERERALKEREGALKERERALKELQQARDSLKRLSHQSESILKSAGEGIYGLDREGKVAFVNPAAAKILGHSAQPMIGQFMHRLVSHSKLEGAPYSWEESPVFDTLHSGNIHHVTGDFFQRQDGLCFPVEYVSTPIQDQGAIIGVVVIFKDITERQVVERMKDEFISVVSHELRTPLTSIRTALGLLAQGNLYISPEKRQRMVEIASSNTHRLVRLVDDILDVERIKLGKVNLNKQVCNLTDLMAQAADEMRAMAEKHGISLSVQPLSVNLWADADRLIQTLTNLLSNAIKFSPAGSTVAMLAQQVRLDHKPHELNSANLHELRAVSALTQKLPAKLLEEPLEGAPEMLLVQVKDQGQGIPESKLDAIFTPFEQLNSSNTGHQGGTGLGLAICRSIIQQHNGRIWAESALGKGSTFFVMLPLLADAESS